MIFNIYYINFPKVYEIKMMLSNVISTGGEFTKENSEGTDIDYKGKLGVKFLNMFNTEFNAGRKNSKSDTQKVLETFEIKTTKSVILNEILERSKNISDFENIKEGELIKIDNISLSLENESELRMVKLVTNGSLKGVTVPGMDGMDFNNFFNSLIKDYSYKLKGKSINNNVEMLIKIPLTFESEFENSYSVDDLFIGKVSLVGLYKGKIKIDKLRNSFQFFQEWSNAQNTNDVSELIQDSQYKDEEPKIDPFNFKSSADKTKNYHYIDLLAIIQNIDIPKQ